MGQFRWTASKLLTYLRCPYAYFLKYKKKPKVSVPVPWYFVFGRSIHKAITVCHKGNPHQYFKATPKRPLFFKNPGAFGRFWCDLWSREVEAAEKGMGIRWKERENEDEQKKKLKGLGRAMLAGTKDSRWRGYYQSILNPPFPIQILECEFFARTDLFSRFPCSAVMDQIWQIQEGTAIVDFTTGRSSNVKFLQMTFYHEILKEYCRVSPIARKRFGSGTKRHYVWNLREEKLIPTSPQNSAKLQEMIEHATTGVHLGEFHETQQDDVCHSCEFQEICEKAVGKAISLKRESGGKLEISIPVRPKLKKPKQLHFKGFRGNQVKGKKRK